MKGAGRSPGRNFGKAPAGFLERVVYRSLGERRREVILGPGKGLDNAVVSAGGSRVLVLTTDPVSLIPRLGPEKSAWLSVHLIASDFATSGLRPQFASFEFNFPPEVAGKEREAYLTGIGRACKSLGIAVVAGHTGSYPGAGLTVVGGGTIFGFGRYDRYVAPSMARVGDAVVMTKGAAIEATASLASAFPESSAKMAGRSLARRALNMVKDCTTVEDAYIAASVGLRGDAVTSMHDATEGGVLGGLEEMAAACGHSIVVQLEKVIVSDEAAAICRAFDIDPLSSLSEGTLLVTAGESAAETVVTRLKARGIRAAVIGSVAEGGGLWEEGPRGKRRIAPRADGYWDAYSKGIEQGIR